MINANKKSTGNLNPAREKKKQKITTTIVSREDCNKCTDSHHSPRQCMFSSHFLLFLQKQQEKQINLSLTSLTFYSR